MKAEEYYRVVSETPTEGFTVEECHKVVSETPSEGFTAKAFYKIIEGPEKADSLEDLDKPPEVEGTHDHEKVKKAIKDYFSKAFSDFGFESKPEQTIDIGGVRGKPDVALYAPKKGKYVAIAEAKQGIKDSNYGRYQLFAYLCLTNTRFGIFANSLDRNNWIFYENLRHFRFRQIKASQFEKEIRKDRYEMPDKPMELEYSQKDFDAIIKAMSKSKVPDVQNAVKTYFSHILQPNWECKGKKKEKIWVNTSEKFKTADLMFLGRDGSYVAIVEFRDNKPDPESILFQLLCATDTRFGIITGGPNPKKWKFYERQGSNAPSEIEEGFEFTAKVIAQARETACPVFKGDKISKEAWDEYSKTWKTLKSEKVWRITKVYHQDCPFTTGKELSNAEYQEAREAYPGCPVKKGTILTKGELSEHCQTWPELAAEKVWRITKVYYQDSTLTVGKELSDAKYQQAREDYPGCPVKKGDILSKKEWKKHQKTWKNLKVEPVWCLTNAEYDEHKKVHAEYQKLQDAHHQTQEEYDRSRSKIKFWQFVTAGAGLFLLCFGTLFLTQRNATEDAVHQKAILANQLTQKQSEIRQQDSEIQNLIASVQTLKSENETLSEENSELENQGQNRNFPIDKSVVGLRKQLNEQKGENQDLKKQLAKKDTKIQQLGNDKAIALQENHRLQKRLVVVQC